MIILSTNSKHWFKTSFLQLLEEGAGKRCSECVLSTDYTYCSFRYLSSELVSLITQCID